jgi:calcineurin-like phosphoesterase family protein
MTVFFTADQHFGHKNLIINGYRNFRDVDHMDDEIIYRYNKVVGKDDDVYILGDFTFYNPSKDADKIISILQRLNGRKHLVPGNHDHKLLKYPEILKYFHSVSTQLIKEIKIVVPNPVPNNSGALCRTTIVLSHYPIKIWRNNHRGYYHLFGHCHGTLPDDHHSKSFDVGVDNFHYTPISFKEVQEIMAKKKFVPFDHHGRKKRLLTRLIYKVKSMFTFW